jgi:hypothetical protein
MLNHIFFVLLGSLAGVTIFALAEESIRCLVRRSKFEKNRVGLMILSSWLPTFIIIYVLKYML